MVLGRDEIINEVINKISNYNKISFEIDITPNLINNELQKDIEDTCKKSGDKCKLDISNSKISIIWK